MSYEDLLQARDYIRSQSDVTPEIGVICGSGLGGLADHLDTDRPRTVICYSDIPHFPTVSGS